MKQLFLEAIERVVTGFLLGLGFTLAAMLVLAL